MNIAIAGDLHGSWLDHDLEVLSKLEPDLVLFVGDLGESDLGASKLIKKLPFPTAVILGNHDRGNDKTGEFLRKQLNLLGQIHCGWSLLESSKLPVAIVGARPCSAGGGYYLSKEVKGVYGQVSLDESVSRIVKAAESAPIDVPLIILAHSGPEGLGSNADSPCGRDWKSPSIDWGDRDLALAIDKLRTKRLPELVVFGHTHHYLRNSEKKRKTFVIDRWGIKYLNAACVPRRGTDSKGNFLCHFSWVEFVNGKLIYASHRWFNNDCLILYEDILLSNKN